MIQRIVARLANRAQIARRVTPPVLRHTFSVAAIQESIALPAIQRFPGCDRRTTREIYLNLLPEEVIPEFQAKW